MKIREFGVLALATIAGLLSAGGHALWRFVFGLSAWTFARYGSFSALLSVADSVLSVFLLVRRRHKLSRDRAVLAAGLP